MASMNHLAVSSIRQSVRQRNKLVNDLEGNEAVCSNTKAAFLLEENAKPVERIDSAMLILRSQPTTEEWSSILDATKNGIALTGTVAERPAGPVIGLVDIGTCDDAYLFRMSLPGVSRDAGEISCEIETNGSVLVKGVTATGQKEVCKYSHTFEMQTQHLCPPGEFSVSFKLPGPVENRGFTAILGDGILEGVILKRDPQVHNKVQAEEEEEEVVPSAPET